MTASFRFQATGYADDRVASTVTLRPKGFSPEPEVGTGLAYSVSVGTERDGGKETCWH